MSTTPKPLGPSDSLLVHTHIYIYTHVCTHTPVFTGAHHVHVHPLTDLTAFLTPTGKYAEALNEYTKAIGLNPGCHVYYSNRAIAAIKLFRFEQVGYGG